MKIAVVWLKKDIRATDHRPLFEASRRADRVIALYIYEPEWLQSYEFDEMHLRFLNQGLEELKSELSLKNIAFVTRCGSAVDVFKKLKSEISYQAVFAHMESGNAWTFYRDLQVQSYLKEAGVFFQEYYQFGVIRKLKSREDWTQLRSKIVQRKLIPEAALLSAKLHAHSEGICSASYLCGKFGLSIPVSTKSDIQIGGSREAHKSLWSFLDNRGRNYLSEISDPYYARNSNSRLSAYIAFGNISLTEIQYALDKAKRVHQYDIKWQRSLEAFESRLWWHCHFIQKLESEFEIEFENMNRAFDGLRESEFNEDYFLAWKKGETGYPLIDATMRCLHKTGWINFRMRAMLVSFASYHLWLHWRKPAEYLASQFLDFEPGIHFSQFQMQSGVTGVNSIRIYSPVKQVQDQKGAAAFIKEFVPELSVVEDCYLDDLESMPPLLLLSSGLKLGEHYPQPIVDHKKVYDLAKKRIFDWKSKPDVRYAARQVLQKHVTPKK